MILFILMELVMLDATNRNPLRVKGTCLLGRVVFSGLYPRLAGLEAPPMRCLKHQKYAQVLIENMERTIEYSLNKTTT